MSIVTGAKFDLTVARARPRRRQPISGRLLWGRLFDTVAAWRRDSRSRGELARMTMRELRDIGITPAERERECHRPFWMG
jgi:uncharacterized protein YjiS (DUF1127 family)